MNTQQKNWIRCLVVLGLLAWPGVELYRYWGARQQLAQNTELARSVRERLAYLKSTQTPAPAEAQPATAPVSNPTPGKLTPSGKL